MPARGRRCLPGLHVVCLLIARDAVDRYRDGPVSEAEGRGGIVLLVGVTRGEKARGGGWRGGGRLMLPLGAAA